MAETLEKTLNSAESSFCNSCGTAYSFDDKFCAGCGQAVNNRATNLVMSLEKLQAQVADLEATVSPAAPELLQARFMLAVAYLRSEQTVKAVEQLQLTTQYDPKNAVARAYLGAALLEEYQLEEAKAELEKAVELAPKNAIVRLKMGEFYLKLGMYSDALVELEAAQQLPPPSPETAAYIRTLLLQTRKRNQRVIARPNNAINLRALNPFQLVKRVKRELTSITANLSSQRSAE